MLTTAWGIDEDDGELFSIADVSKIGQGPQAAGFVSYGPLKYDRTGRGELRSLGHNIEAMALTPDGTVYMAYNSKLDRSGALRHIQGPILLKYDVNDATSAAPNVVTVVGAIKSRSPITGLDFHPTTGELYGNTSTHLLKISTTDPSRVTVLGKMENKSRRLDCKSCEDIAFDERGNLYVTDNTTDRLYQLNPASGQIMVVADNNERGGVTPATKNLKIEALAWDSLTGKLLGFDDNSNQFILLSLENGNNQTLGRLPGLTDVEGLRFAAATRDTAPPIIAAALANDTAPGGTSNSDRITSDPSVAGTIQDASPIIRFVASLDTTASDRLLDVLSSLRPDGGFVFDRARLEEINRGPLADGPHTLYLQATDERGNVSSFFDIFFELDTTAPAAPTGLSLAPGSDTGSSGTDGITMIESPTVVGDAESGAIVQLFVGGVAVGQTTANSPWQIPTGPLSEGRHTVTATAEDPAGNISGMSAEFIVEVDRTPPEVPMFDLDPASDTDPLGDMTTTLAMVTLVGTTTRDAKVELLETGAMTTSDVNGAFEFTNVPLALGGNDFTIRVTDLAGNQVSFTKTITRLDGESLQLRELDRFLVEAMTTIDLTANESKHRQIRIDFEALFDVSDQESSLEDIFSIYLVDPNDTSTTLLDRGTNGTAFFSLIGDRAEFVPGLVRYDGSSVLITTQGIDGFTEGKLVFQLLNSDDDTGTVVTYPSVTNTEVENGGLRPLVFNVQADLASPGPERDLAGLTATTDVAVIFQNVRFDAVSGRYVAEMKLQNNGPDLGRQLLVLLPDLPEGVHVLNPSGVDYMGTPYYNMTPAVRAGGLNAEAMSRAVQVEIDNPGQLRFSLRPIVLSGGANRAPVLAAIEPLTAMPGQAIQVPLFATDEDDDPVTFAVSSFAALPSGSLRGDAQLEFTPKLNQLGTYMFDVIASDGALEARQSVTLNVVADPNTTTRISGVVRTTLDQPLDGVPVEIAGFTAVTAADGSFTIALPTLKVPTQSFNIPIPVGDPHFDPFNTGTQEIRLRRARPDVTTGDSPLNPLQHPNLVTSFIDGSIVYGSDEARATALRTMVDGKLKTSAGNLLPYNNLATFPNGTLENDNEGRLDPATLFASGDVRTNENVPLIALHTLLVREHNRLADEIKAANPAFTDEQIYQHARRLVGAILQHITYNEYLPLLLGPTAIASYTGYDPNVDPRESSMFAAAAFRVGHTQLFDRILRLDASGQSLSGGPLTLKDAFFTPAPIAADGIEPFLRGLAAAQAQQVDTQIIDDVRNFLFGPPGSGGMDLASLNIQRGRDMGLPTYNQARVDFGLPRVTSFSQISSDPAVQSALQSIYGSVDKIDVWVGGIAEDQAPGALIGPLFQRIIADQFRRSRDSDRFWYENGQFMADELAFIRSTTLTSLIERNTTITGLPANVFTTGPLSGAVAPAGTSASAAPSEFRTFDGTGNNLLNSKLGSTQSNLLNNFTLAYGDGISTPAGSDRPNPRAISNAVNAQSTSTPNTAGATGFLVFWGQLIDHDLGLTPGGVSNTLKIHGNQRPNPSGNEPYPFVAEPMDLLLDHAVYPTVNNVIRRPIYLPVIDSSNAVTIDPARDTIVTTAAIPDLSLLVQSGTLRDRNGVLFNGQLSITEVPRDLTPASLPTGVFPDFVITIQPAEMVFSSPAPVTFPNRTGAPPGTRMDLYSINLVTGEFDDVGDMQVSADGSRIETIAGGLRNTSWGFPAPPPPPNPTPPNKDGRNNDKDCKSCGAGAQATSEVMLHSGALQETHDLVPYQSLGSIRGLTLTYDSERADPRPILHFGYDNALSRGDNLMFASLTVKRGNFEMIVPGSSGFVQGPNISGVVPRNAHFWKLNSDDADAALQVDLRAQPSGRYIFDLNFGLGQGVVETLSCPAGVPCSAEDVYRFSGSSQLSSWENVSVNSIDSSFGAGWGLGGLQQIIENPDGSLVLIDADSELLFEPPTTPGGKYLSPPGDFSILEKLADGRFRQTFPDQTTLLFGTDGKLRTATDRNNSVTTYVYDGQGRVTDIVDPVGLRTTMSYTAGRVTTITDPADRETRLEYDAAGNLIRITDPDGSSRTFTYDKFHHMTSEVDQRGLREQLLYGFHGRVTEVVRKDGTRVLFDPVQTQGLLPPDRTINPLRAPFAFSLGEPVANFSDGNGNLVATTLDQAGQEVSRVDGVGALPTVQRGSDNLITSQTDARGNATFFSYDSRGNLLTIWDETLTPQSAIGEIAVSGERDRYVFTLDQPSRLYFDSLTNNSSLFWTLEGPAGVLANRSFSNSDQFHPVVNAVEGQYTLTVHGAGDATGAYQFRLRDLDTAIPVSLNSSMTGTLKPASETDLFSFTASVGDQLFFDLQNSNAFNATWRLVDPLGNDVFNQFLSDVSRVTVLQVGTYILAVEGSHFDFGNPAYTFSIDFIGNSPLPPILGDPLSLGETISGSIGAPAEQDRYTFTLLEGQNLYLDALALDGDLSWTLTGPSGTTLTQRHFSSSDWFSSLRELRLPAGTYGLTVDGVGDATGNYQFRLLDLASATPRTVGTTVSGSLSPLSETDAYRFNATTGDRYFFDVQTSDNMGNATWRLLDPYGTEVFHQYFSYGDVNTLTLQTEGTYTLLLEGYVFDTGTGNYEFKVQPVMDAAPIAVTVGANVNGAIDVAGGQVRYTFTLPVEQNLYLDALALDGDLSWTLTGPSGTTLTQRHFSSSDWFSSLRELRLSAGTYMLTVDGLGDATGSYQFHLLDLASATPRTVGTTVSGSLSPLSETDIYRFDAATGDRFYFDVQTSDNMGSAAWRLIDPYGVEIFNTWFGDIDTVTLNAAGTYTLLVEGYVFDTGTGNYEFKVQPVMDAAPIALTVSANVNGAIDVAGGQVRYTFTLPVEQNLYLDALAFDGDLNWNLTGPSGTTLTQRHFSSSDWFSSLRELRLSAGTYTLTVDGVGDATGSYQFRLLDLASATPLTVGTMVTGSLSPLSETDAYRFNAATGDRFYFDVQTSDNMGSAAWRLIDPYGVEIFNTWFGDIDTVTLNAAGTYTLLVEGYVFDTGTGNYEFKVQPVMDAAPVALTLGTTVSGGIDVTGERDRYAFTLPAAQNLYFDALAVDGNLNWMLTGPSGTILTQRDFTSSDRFSSLGELRLPAGAYILTVDGAGDATGNYEFRLLDLANATPLTVGTTVSGSLSPLSETDAYRFNAASGDRLFFDVQTSDNMSFATWRLLDPYGTELFNTFFFFGDVDTLTVPAAGTYTLLVEGHVLDTGVGNYAFNVQFQGNTPPPPMNGTPLVLGTTIEGAILTAGEQDLYTFTLPAAQNLYFDALAVDGNLNWMLTGPSGTTLAQRDFIFSDWFGSLRELRLPAGTYTLTVIGVGDATGSYQFRLLDLASATPLTVGTTVSGLLSPPSETDAYQFNASSGDRLFFDVQTSDNMGNVRWRLLDPYGTEVFHQGFSDVDTLTVPAAGTYTLLVEGYVFETGIGNYEFKVQRVTDVAPIAVTVGANVNGAIDVTGGQVRYTLTLPVAQNLYFDALTIDGDLNWTLTGPSGTTLTQRGFSSSDWFSSLRELRLPAGAYTLTVDGLRDATGSYQFRLLDLASATPLTVGTTVSGSLSPLSETDAYRFDAAAGDRYFFDVQTSDNMGNVRWRLLDPYGTEVFHQGFSDVDTLTVPAAGAYTLLVEGYIFDTGTGNYEFKVQPVMDAAPIAVTVGANVNGAIDVAGGQNRYTFTLPVAQNLYFDALAFDGDLNWTLTGPSGTTLTQRGFSSSDWFSSLQELRLPAGAYTLTVDGVGDATGSYQFRLLDLASATPLTVGTTVSGSLSPLSETDAYRFDAAAGDRFFFDVQTSDNMGSAAWRLIDPFGVEIFNTAFFGDIDTVTLNAGGTYTLLVEGYIFDTGTGNYEFKVVPVAQPSTQLIVPRAGQPQRFSYDPIFNQVTSITDELGRQTIFDLDPVNGNVLSITRVVGQPGGDDDVVTSFTYTALGLVDTVTDPLGRVTDNDYDTFGRLTTITFAVGTPDQAMQLFEYDAAGNLRAFIDENGNRTEHGYDAMNRLVSITQPDPDGPGPLASPVTTFDYDSNGNLIETIDARNNKTIHQYDVLDRLVKTVDANSQESTFNYDKAGNLVSTRDPLGHETRNRYDARNRLIETSDATGGSTRFTYDADNNLASLTDPVGNTTQFDYDARNRLVREIDPLSNSIFYIYDAVDNLIGKTDRNGRLTEFAYDDLNRLATETWVNGNNTVNYVYDKASNLTAVVDTLSALAFTYDNRDRVKAVNSAGPAAPNVILNYVYDAVGNVLSVADSINSAAGATTANIYDALNRMTRLTQTGVGLADKRVDLAYNQLGQFDSINRFSDLAGTQLVVGTTYAYDPLNRLTSLTHNGTNSTIAFYNFTYDSASRITRITDIDGFTDYSYDDRDQLIGANHSNLSKPDETYVYDANGNRISSSLHGSGYVTGPANRLRSDGTYNYDYDNEGNLIRRTEVATGNYREFTWDYRNRLVAVIDREASGTPTQEVRFTYDAFDRRISKAVDITPLDAIDAVITQFVYDREDVILDFVDSDRTGPNAATLDKRYLHGPAVDQVFAQDDAAGGVQWHLADHLGTVRDLADNAGVVRNHIVYGSFGNVISETNATVDSRYLFTGRESDDNVALYYYRARYYDSVKGRFIAEDPAGLLEGDNNLFRYVRNSPLLFVDPSGAISIQTVCALIAGIATFCAATGSCGFHLPGPDLSTMKEGLECADKCVADFGTPRPGENRKEQIDRQVNLQECTQKCISQTVGVP